jgi:uncharacterized protein YggE
MNKLSKEYTMKKTHFLIAVMLVLATVLSACGATAQTASPRNMSVNGTGTVSMTPDIAYIYLGVHSENPSASESVADNNVQTQKVIDALKKLGIDENDIRTTNFSIWPSTQYSPDGLVTGTSYVVDNTVYVTIRDLTKLGDLLDSVISAGANTVNSIQFDVADKTEALKQARDEAVKSAELQAQELATVAGVTLGEVQNIGFYDSVPVPSTFTGGKGGGGGAADVSIPIQPGQLTLTVTVSMTYEIK